MENINMAKDCRGEEDSPQCVTGNIESADESLLSKRFTRKLEPEHNLVLKRERSRMNTSCRELFLHSDHGLYYRIPKHIIGIDEKKVLGCLELICRNRLREADSNFASEVNTVSDSLANLSCRSSYDMAKLFIECPLPDGNCNVIASSTGINSTITCSDNTDILKSPSFNRLGDSNANSRRTSSLEICEPACFEFVNPPRVLSSSSSSGKLMKDATVLNHVYASAPLHKRIIPGSSTKSTCSDQSSSSSSSSSSCATFFKGIMQCTWKNGLPQYAFSVDDKREVYVASSFKVESPDNKVLDYVYTFHSLENGSKVCDTREVEPELVGKMRVSSSITFCSNKSEIAETRFVLFRSDGNNLGEMQSSSHSLQQNKRLTRRIVDVFKSTHSYKERSSSKFEGTSAGFEDTYRHPSHQVQNSPNPVKVSVDNQYAPNLELAAIVVRHHTCNKSKEAEIGGWGLKFLKNSGNKSSMSSERCPQNCGECSTSMNIIVPADVHGGPRTRIGGPSSLIERWISGGRCDCGGWDIGCPLTVLDTGSCTMEASPHNSKECKSFELFIQGSKQNTPIIKMVNIHEGLYYIHFQSTLSSLQSFAIAASIFHSRTSILRL